MTDKSKKQKMAEAPQARIRKLTPAIEAKRTEVAGLKAQLVASREELDSMREERKQLRTEILSAQE